MSAVPIIVSLICTVLADMAAPVDRSFSDGVTSTGYNVMYGDEDLTVINQAVVKEEKWSSMRKESDLYRSLPPLPAQDVKCIMSVDRYCTKDMGKMKNILIQSLKDDCAKCSSEEKENAGRVVASMMAHDPTAWKTFLTRSTLQILPEKKSPKQVKHRYKITGEPEYIENTKNRHTMPGFEVRVKRYVTEIIN